MHVKHDADRQSGDARQRQRSDIDAIELPPELRGRATEKKEPISACAPKWAKRPICSRKSSMREPPRHGDTEKTEWRQRHLFHYSMAGRLSCVAEPVWRRSSIFLDASGRNRYLPNAMDEWDLIEARYSFRLPAIYRELQAAGHFDHTQSDRYIEFTDHHWISPAAIASHEFCPWQSYTRSFLVPFSHSARRDEWGWRRDWIVGSEPAIVFCDARSRRAWVCSGFSRLPLSHAARGVLRNLAAGEPRRPRRDVEGGSSRCSDRSASTRSVGQPNRRPIEAAVAHRR